MQRVAGVEVVHRLDQLAGDLLDGGQREAAAAALHVAEAFAFDIFHRKEDRAELLERILDLHDAGMARLGDGDDLGDQHLAVAGEETGSASIEPSARRRPLMGQASLIATSMPVRSCRPR